MLVEKPCESIQICWVVEDCFQMTTGEEQLRSLLKFIFAASSSVWLYWVHQVEATRLQAVEANRVQTLRVAMSCLQLWQVLDLACLCLVDRVPLGLDSLKGIRIGGKVELFEAKGTATRDKSS